MDQTGGSRETSLLTRRQAAAMLGVSVDTLARLIDRGELRAARIGRSVRVSEADVAAFAERVLGCGVMSARDDDRADDSSARHRTPRTVTPPNQREDMS